MTLPACLQFPEVLQRPTPGPCRALRPRPCSALDLSLFKRKMGIVDHSQRPLVLRQGLRGRS